jgi:hypothetical protein
VPLAQKSTDLHANILIRIGFLESCLRAKPVGGGYVYAKNAGFYRRLTRVNLQKMQERVLREVVM